MCPRLTPSGSTVTSCAEVGVEIQEGRIGGIVVEDIDPGIAGLDEPGHLPFQRGDQVPRIDEDREFPVIELQFARPPFASEVIRSRPGRPGPSIPGSSRTQHLQDLGQQDVGRDRRIAAGPGLRPSAAASRRSGTRRRPFPFRCPVTTRAGNGGSRRPGWSRGKRSAPGCSARRSSKTPVAGLLTWRRSGERATAACRSISGRPSPVSPGIDRLVLEITDNLRRLPRKVRRSMGVCTRPLRARALGSGRPGRLGEGRVGAYLFPLTTD